MEVHSMLGFLLVFWKKQDPSVFFQRDKYHRFQEIEFQNRKENCAKQQYHNPSVFIPHARSKSEHQSFWIKEKFWKLGDENDA